MPANIIRFALSSIRVIALIVFLFVSPLSLLADEVAFDHGAVLNPLEEESILLPEPHEMKLLRTSARTSLVVEGKLLWSIPAPFTVTAWAASSDRSLTLFQVDFLGSLGSLGEQGPSANPNGSRRENKVAVVGDGQQNPPTENKAMVPVRSMVGINYFCVYALKPNATGMVLEGPLFCRNQNDERAPWVTRFLGKSEDNKQIHLRLCRKVGDSPNLRAEHYRQWWDVESGQPLSEPEIETRR